MFFERFSLFYFIRLLLAKTEGQSKLRPSKNMHVVIRESYCNIFKACLYHAKTAEVNFMNFGTEIAVTRENLVIVMHTFYPSSSY